MKRFTHIVVWMSTLTVIVGVLLFFEGDLLWKLQQMNLFIPSQIFFSEQMLVPGGLLTWVATFFTQFFAWPWIGVLLLAAWWWLLMWLLKRAFLIPNQWAVLLLIPVALLLTTITDMGYWIYVLKLQGLCFVATIGTTAVAALLWAYRRLPASHWQRTLFLVAVCIFGFPLLGIYGLAAPLLMALWSWRLKGHPLADTIIAVLGVIAVPLLCYRYVYYQTNLANLYYAELPLYYVSESCTVYYVPFMLLALFFVVMVVLPSSLFKPVSSTWKSVVVQIVPLLLIAAGIYYSWFKDENFHRELAMQHRTEQLDWEGVLEEAARQEDEPTRAIVMMRNLALGRLGRQGNQMFLYKNGAKDFASPFGMRTMLVVGPLMYYQYGLINYSARLCTEMGVEFGWRAEYLQTLAKCAMLNGEQQHARKYLNLLGRTLTFSDWAEQKGRLTGDSVAIANDPEMGFVKRMMHYDENLTSDQGYVERFLMTCLARSRYTGDPLFQEQALLATLWTKDISQFWRHFSDYIRLHPRDPMPRYYQEAALLYATIEERDDVDRMPFDKGVRDTYQHFMEASVPYNDGDVEVARQGLKLFYGQTYYYDYYLMSNLPEY